MIHISTGTFGAKYTQYFTKIYIYSLDLQNLQKYIFIH
jgi:hypothetical protein